jgi:hypothetical protein
MRSLTHAEKTKTCYSSSAIRLGCLLAHSGQSGKYRTRPGTAGADVMMSFATTSLARIIRKDIFVRICNKTCYNNAIAEEWPWGLSKKFAR